MIKVAAFARGDISSSYAWYNEQREGLGAEFIDELGALFSRIEASPLQFPAAVHGLRKAALRRFPYSIYFRHRGDDIMIAAVLHHRRDIVILNERS